MSRVAIIKALESGLALVSPALPTIFENETNAAVATGPTDTYQRTNTLFAEAITNEKGEAQTEHGFYQITYCYPAGQGIGPPLARADLVGLTFVRTGSFASGGIVVNIESQSAGEHRPDGDHDVLPHRIRFWANVQP